MRSVPVAFCSLLLVIGRPAFAQESSPPAAEQVQSAPLRAPSPTSYVLPAPAPTLESHWYGWQTVIPDAVGVSLVAAGIGANPSGSGGTVLAVSAIAILSLDGPIVHIVHRRYGIAAASFGVRVGGAVVGAIVGGVAASGTKQDPDADVPPGLVGGLYGFGIGAMAGMVVDDAVLSWEKVPVAHPLPVTNVGSSLALAPLVGRGHEGLGVVGSF